MRWWALTLLRLVHHQTTAAPSLYSIPTGRGVISEVTPTRQLTRLVLTFY